MHTDNTWSSRTCVIKEYQYYTISLSKYHGRCQYHISVTIGSKAVQKKRSRPEKNHSKKVKIGQKRSNGNKTVKTVVVLGWSTMVFGRFTMVLGRSTMVLMRSTMVLGMFTMVLTISAMMLGRSTMVLGRPTAVLGRSTMVLGRVTMVLGRLPLC